MVVAKKKRLPESREAWQKALKELRDRLDITQAEAASRAGLPVRTWIGWENKQATPSRMALHLLRLAFPGEFPEE